MTNYFRISRGVRQGCVLSPLLFFLARVEILASKVRQDRALMALNVQERKNLKSLNFFFFKLIIIHYHTQQQKKIMFKPRIKLNNNICIAIDDKCSLCVQPDSLEHTFLHCQDFIDLLEASVQWFGVNHNIVLNISPSEALLIKVPEYLLMTSPLKKNCVSFCCE